MTVHAFASAKGSPGVTTLVLSLAAVWPEPGATAIEADPAGGDVAARAHCALDPGLVTLAAAVRRGGDETTAAAHCQPIGGGIPVVVGPPSAEQARAALGAGPHLAPAISASGDVLVDLGRLEPGASAHPLLGIADRLVVVLRPTVEQVHHAAALVHGLRGADRATLLVVVGTRPHRPAEVREVVGCDLAGVMPLDPRCVGALYGTPASRKAMLRSPLLRAARAIADHLAAPIPDAGMDDPVVSGEAVG